MHLLKEWNTIINEHFRDINNYLEKTKELHNEYSERNNNKSDIGFNVFTLSSDFYYRENFHSDIIKAFLNPLEKHSEGSKYLEIFIDLLNKNGGKKILKTDFKNSSVQREKHNIDILITNELSKKAIIVENKINNAIDQERQLPRYVEIVKSEYEVVVYLTLNSSKQPNKNDWTEEELKEINDILKIIPAFQGDTSKISLYENWIVPSIINSVNIDSSLLLRQYGNLIKYLNTNTMDTVSIEKFYNTLKENENHKTAISIRNMLNDLPEYLAIRIEDKYKSKCYPFKKIWRYKQRDTVFDGCEIGELYLKLDIWCSESGYEVHFWRPNVPEFDISAEFKTKFDFLQGFSIHNNEINNIKKHFTIFQEIDMFEFIDALLSGLKNVKDNK